MNVQQTTQPWKLKLGGLEVGTTNFGVWIPLYTGAAALSLGSEPHHMPTIAWTVAIL